MRGSQKSIRFSCENVDSSTYEESRVRQISKQVQQWPSQKYTRYQNGASQEILQDEQNQSKYRDYSGKK